MADNLNDDLTSNTGSPRKPLHDEVTKNKIDKHLSDINDTISEQDIKNIKTNIPAAPKGHVKDSTDSLDDNKDESDFEKPKKEMPNTWDMIDE